MQSPDVAVHEDERGRFIVVWRGNDFHEINYFEIKRGASRGGHYHKRNRELMIVGKGIVTLRVEDVRSGRTGERVVRAGDCFVIEPFEKHTLTALEDAALFAGNTVPPFEQGDRHDVYTD